MRREEIRFCDLTAEGENLIFCIPLTFDPKEVFGIGGPRDTIMIYAEYDIRQGKALRSLRLVDHLDDGSDRSLRYLLSMEERKTLEIQMERFCWKQYGMGLKAYVQKHVRMVRP